MMTKFTLRKSLVVVLAVFCLAAAAIVMILQKPTANATESDTVTVKSVSVTWDPDTSSHNQDWIFIELDGADFTTSNEPSNKHWDWFSPFIYVNGVALSENDGFVMWCSKGYPSSAKYAVFIQRGKEYSLKNDGTDVIEVKAGCKFPKSGDETLGDIDYYLVSQSAAFSSTSAGNTTGEEAFTSGSPVTVSGISVEWDGNGGNQDYIMIRLNGAAFTLNVHSNGHWAYFAPFVYVNGEAVTGKVAWATEGMYGDARQFCFFIAQETLKQDGTDVIEVRKGCRIPINDGERCYYVTETATFAASDETTTGTTTKFHRTMEVGTTYDADESIFNVSAEGEKIGEYTSLPILPGYIDNFGVTKWADYSNAAFAVDKYGKFTLLSAIDVTTVKSVSLKILYPAAALFYVYPINATSLVYENAIQSFRTPGGLQMITLSTELLAAGGQFGGFILQMVEGTGAQFFVDDITPLAETYTPDTVEKIEEFAWEVGTKYDADGTVFGVSAEGEKIGDFTSLAVVSENIDSFVTQWATFTGNFSNGSYAKFKLQNAMDVATVKSVTITVFRNTADVFYVYPLNASVLGVGYAAQSFRTVGGSQKITLLTESLAVDGQFGGFILQMIDGTTGQQLFVDDITPLADVVNVTLGSGSVADSSAKTVSFNNSVWSGTLASGEYYGNIYALDGTKFEAADATNLPVYIIPSVSGEGNNVVISLANVKNVSDVTEFVIKKSEVFIGAGVPFFFDKDYLVTCNFGGTPTVTAYDDFKMNSGAYIRLGDVNGLRFTANVSKSLVTSYESAGYAVSAGMVILPYDYMAEKGEFSATNIFGSAYASVEIINLSANLVYYSESEYRINGSIVSIKDANLEKKFVGRAYLKLEKGGAVTYIMSSYYGSDIDNNSRTVMEIAEAAYADENVSAEDKAIIKELYIDKKQPTA